MNAFCSMVHVTPHTCARGKVIGSVVVVVVVVSTKIARSQGAGILVSGQCRQDIINDEKVMSLCF